MYQREHEVDITQLLNGVTKDITECGWKRTIEPRTVYLESGKKHSTKYPETNTKRNRTV